MLLRWGIRATRPQILLYERFPSGEYRLNAVEFIIPYRLWAPDSVAPILMGQRLHHEDNLKIWYLHVWAWLKPLSVRPEHYNVQLGRAMNRPSTNPTL